MFGLLRSIFEEEERQRVQEMQKIQPNVNWSGKVDHSMSKHSHRENMRKLRWQERQRSTHTSPSNRSERGNVEMSNNSDRPGIPPNFHDFFMSQLMERSRSSEVTLSFETSEDANSRQSREAFERQKKAQVALDKLAALPGMEHIKEQVEQIIALKKVSEQRMAAGLKTEPQSLHMAFLGNPGTGKTTAARLVGEAFILMGLLKSKHSVPPFVEVHHSDIESMYVGESEKKMSQKFEQARGGVLFMDEVYAFGGPHHYHKTFLANLVSKIEDMRDEVLVIAAGYKEETQDFLDENPGLRSRFPTIIDFPNYEEQPLLDIADLMAKERDYVVTPSYRRQLLERLTKEKELPSFGNARTVRNILEQSVRLHAKRMMGIENPNKQTLMELTMLDIDMTVRIPPPKKEKPSLSGMIVVSDGKSDKLGPRRAGEGQ